MESLNSMTWPGIVALTVLVAGACYLLPKLARGLLDFWRDL
jgi:hypothetical protein